MRAKKGFTLIEVLVAMFLTGLVLAGLVGVWMSATNFASSDRQELMYKNLLSVGARKMFQDVSESTYTDFNPTACLQGGTRLMKIFKNYNPKTGSCIVNIADNHTAVSVFYCYREDTQNVYREEASFACGTPAVYDCACAKNGNIVASNLESPPTIMKEGTNGLHIKFSARIMVGSRNPRPVHIDYNKTFSSIADNNVGQ